MSNYVVRIIRFKCVDESGLDFLGSDEPFWVFTAKDPKGNVNTTRSKTFGSVDSGNVEKFETDNNRNIIWPKKGDTKGSPGPIGLSIQVWEKDQGNEDDIAAKTNKVFDLGSKAPLVGDWVGLVGDLVRGKIASFIGNDLMGSTTVLFREKPLRLALPNVGDRMRKTFRLGGMGGDLPFQVAGGPDYDLLIEVQKVA